ncbi:MAG TPA: thioesterase family protein [Gammaproteobacteria bacterium]|nr:thioesterase family protein [Gammaproteobacteria bacterium]
MIETSVTIRIPFHHVDVMAMAWHGHYVKYFEEARDALLDRIGYNYLEMRASGYVWPVIDMRIKYIKPVELGGSIRVQASLAEYENRLKIEYLITDPSTGARLTTGYTSQVAVHLESKEMRLVSPDILFQKLGVAVP